MAELELGSPWREWRILCGTLTPIWAGGAVKGECARQLKGSTLMGSLRYWAVEECRAKNLKACGGTDWCGEDDCLVCDAFGSTGQARQFDLTVDKLEYDAEKGGFWGDEFTIAIRFRAGRQQQRKAAALAAFAVSRAGSRGAIGARTQHGYGQIGVLGIQIPRND